MTSFLMSMHNYNWLNLNGKTNKSTLPYLEKKTLADTFNEDEAEIKGAVDPVTRILVGRRSHRRMRSPSHYQD